jgi:hypothetical protein
MTNRRIEIDVVLNADKAEKGFEQLEDGSKAVGESFNSVGDAVSSLGGEANEALGNVGGALSGVVDGFSELSGAAKSGEMSFSALVGPIGIAAVALFELVQAFREYSNEASGANIRSDAYIASTAELTSAVEELAAAQVILNKEQIKELRILSMAAKLPLEQAQGIREKNEKLDKSIQLLKSEIKQLERSSTANLLNAQANDLAGLAIGRQAAARDKLTRKRAELAKKEAEADRLTQKGAENFAKFEALKEERLKQSPEFRKQLAEQESKLLDAARLSELEATKGQIKTQIEIAKIGSKQKTRELKAIEDISEKVRSRAIKAEAKRLQAEIRQIRSASFEKQKAINEKRRAEKALIDAKEATARLMLERQTTAELQQIRNLELQSMEINGANQLDILTLRYDEELTLAKDNLNKQEIARLQYQNAVDRIVQNDIKKDEELAKQRQAFLLNNREFDLSLEQDTLQKRLKILSLSYEKEKTLNQNTQEEITELNRREAIERKHIQDEALSAQFSQLESMGKQLASAGVDAAYSSIVAQGEFKKGVGEAIFAIGKQAAVQAVFQGATSLARLAIGDIAGASIAGKAAAGYAGAAAIAGVTANRLGVGGGGGGSGGDTSPTALPQTQTTPAREKAESTEVVYNINFGGAVIYDTQTAAEQALADRLTNLQNRNRRGSPRPRRGT